MPVFTPYMFENEIYPYKIPQLPYKSNALEPLFSAEAIEIH